MEMSLVKLDVRLLVCFPLRTVCTSWRWPPFTQQLPGSQRRRNDRQLASPANNIDVRCNDVYPPGKLLVGPVAGRGPGLQGAV